MRRKTARPYGQSTSGMRLMSMVMAMLVLWMLYQRLKDPATWRAIADDHNAKPAQIEQAAQEPKPAQEPEDLIPGLNDRDPDELAAVQKMFEVVMDRAPLKSREMDLYWRMMNWSRTEPFDQLEQRAQDDVPFTKLWEQPERFRGKLIRLRLHVRRVLKHDDAPDNPVGTKNVYEAWGWTEESRSFPYVVIFPDPPEGLPIGTDVRAEVVFVGYFLKIMTYTAFDHQRGAPLFVGRARLASVPVAAAPSKSDPWIIPLVLIGGTCFIGFSIWSGIRSRGKSKAKMLPKELLVVDSSDGSDLDNPFAQIDAEQPFSDRRIPPGTFNFRDEGENKEEDPAAQPAAEVKT